MKYNINPSTKEEQVPNINPSTQEEVKIAPVTGPVYNEVELKNTCGEIYCLHIQPMIPVV